MELPPNVKMTPMLEQYVYWKDKYPDCLLFFRMGDFYEMFFDDAKTAAGVLNIVLTSRSKDASSRIPMAGVPVHSVDNYLGRLVAAGFRVAICEQMTEPDGRTLVERSVNRIVTSGTWLPENSEAEGKIAACVLNAKFISLALLDAATGSLKAGTFAQERGFAFLCGFSPDEILLPRGQSSVFRDSCPSLSRKNISERAKEEFDAGAGAAWLCGKWNVASLSAMGTDDRDAATGAAAAALRYLEETQFSKASHITCLTPIIPKENLVLDENTQANLELTTQGDTSLFWALNRCRTAMGRRLLKEWISAPLQDTDAISRRLDAVEALVDDASLRERLADALSVCRDMGRSLSRITLKMAAPRDLQLIKETLNAVPTVRETASLSAALAPFAPGYDTDDLAALLDAAISDSPPRLWRDGGVVKDGYDEELDKWRSAARNAAERLSSFEAKERERTGIKNLKAGFNKIFGYYIEIPKTSAAKAPDSYVRRQTLVNAERFINDELKDFEREMQSAESEILAIEEKIYASVIAFATEKSRAVQTATARLAELDVLASLATVSAERGYCRPVIDMSADFVVKNARHPVIETALGKNPFTPNDFNFSEEKGRGIAIITGPNMAGKSTYLRTAALIAIMAHMGSFVPAESARIGLVDRVFTRIGAHDELSRGQSTFMVEMVETANILRHVGERSLVILDEVGRGTSTYDGLSIAWSVVEFLQAKGDKRPRVLFATHYHELTKLAQSLSGVVNLSMKVEESERGVVFLHKVVDAPADRSYGIEVARLAGVPAAVLQRSEELLSMFEEKEKENDARLAGKENNQLRLFDADREAVLEELAACDPDNMTPLSALELVSRLRADSRKALGFK